MSRPRSSVLACLALFACSTGGSGAGIEDLERELRADLGADRVADLGAALWADPRWARLRDDPELRPRITRLLRDYPTSRVTIATAEEPGRRLEFEGTVTEADGRPVAGALVHVYHAGADGRYSPEAGAPGDGNRNARLFAWLRTDADGRFGIRTILPGGYGGAPPHFHFAVSRSRDGSGPRQGGAIYFEGDWPMDPEVYDDAQSGHAVVSPVRPGRDGGLTASATIVLR